MPASSRSRRSSSRARAPFARCSPGSSTRGCRRCSWEARPMRPSLSEADCRAVDRSDMAAKIAGLPAQIRHQRSALAADPWPRDLASPTLVAVGGMGGSAIASDLVLGLTAERLAFPTLVVRDERWPAAVRPGALAVLSSYSGATEETLALCREAERRGVARVGLTTGGPLGERLTATRSPWKGLPAGLP